MRISEDIKIMHSISKSQFVLGLQCQKALWMFRNQRDLIPEITPEKKEILDAGNLVGQIAMDRYPDGVEVVNEYWDVNGAIKSTEKFINDGENVIFEAAAAHSLNGAYSKIDILKHVDKTDEWDLIEVKSSTEVKSYHEDDLAFQYYVFNNSGYKIRNCYIMHIDKTYKRIGNINPTKFFRCEDISETVISKQEQIEYSTNELCDVLLKSEIPNIKIGAKCFKPFECNFKNHCWKHIPEYSVYNIFQKKKAEIIERDHGATLETLPLELYPSGLKNIDLTSYFSGKTKVEEEKILNFLEDLKYPIHFFDYETIAQAIPIFQDTSPFQQIPFQFSLHIQETSNEEPNHFEYIHKDMDDPRYELIKKLITLCGTKGSILVYNQSFEIARNNELARDFPEFKDALEAINSRIIDLMTPFKQRWLYHPQQEGSVSLKSVLPAFTDLDYADLEIGNGGDAMRQYSSFVKGNLEKSLVNDLWNDLSEYCKRDTYALYKLLLVLTNIAK